MSRKRKIDVELTPLFASEMSAYEARVRSLNAPAPSSTDAAPSSPNHLVNTDEESEPGEAVQDETEQLYLQVPDAPEIEYDSTAEDDSRLTSLAGRRRVETQLRGPHRLCNFPNHEASIVTRTHTEVILDLEKHQSLALLGQYDVHLLSGEIFIHGAHLRPSSTLHRVYAPSTHSIPIVQCVSEKPARIEIWDCRHTMRLLKRLSPLYSRIWNFRTSDEDLMARYPGAHDRRSFSLMRWSVDDPLKRYLYPLTIDSAWSEATRNLFGRLAPGQTVLVTGPKASGKSTFCRLLANYIVTEKRNWPATIPGFRDWTAPTCVYLLDLDPNQPEFAPPGQVSLVRMSSPSFGPSYTHQAATSLPGCKMVRAHHIGFQSPADDIKHYLLCAEDLMRAYEDVSMPAEPGPLVINCCASTFEAGTDVMLQLLDNLKVGNVVYLSTIVPRYLRSQMEACRYQPNLTHLQPQPSRMTSRTPADLRAMQMMSYFHQDTPLNGHARWCHQPLATMRPWVVSYGDESPDIRGLLFLGDALPPESLAIVLDGSIVSIDVIEDETAFALYKQDTVTPGEDESRLGSNGNAAHFGGSSGALVRSGQHENSVGDSWSSIPLKDPQPSALEHQPHVLRTPGENLPYFPFSMAGVGIPLDPRKSQTIGLALIRAIDVRNQTLHILTPVPEDIIESVTSESSGTQSKVVFVRGKLDTPDWAYQEDYWATQSAARKVSSAQDSTTAEVFGADYDQDEERTPVNIPWIEEIGPGSRPIGVDLPRMLQKS